MNKKASIVIYMVSFFLQLNTAEEKVSLTQYNIMKKMGLNENHITYSSVFFLQKKHIECVKEFSRMRLSDDINSSFRELKKQYREVLREKRLKWSKDMLKDFLHCLIFVNLIKGVGNNVETRKDVLKAFNNNFGTCFRGRCRCDHQFVSIHAKPALFNYYENLSLNEESVCAQNHLLLVQKLRELINNNSNQIQASKLSWWPYRKDVLCLSLASVGAASLYSLYAVLDTQKDN